MLFERYLKPLKPIQDDVFWVSPAFKLQSSFQRALHVSDLLFRNFADYHIARHKVHAISSGQPQSGNCTIQIKNTYIDEGDTIQIRGTSYQVGKFINTGRHQASSLLMPKSVDTDGHLILKQPLHQANSYRSLISANILSILEKSATPGVVKHVALVGGPSGVCSIQTPLPIPNEIFDGNHPFAVRRGKENAPFLKRIRNTRLGKYAASKVGAILNQTGIKLDDVITRINSLNNVAVRRDRVTGKRILNGADDLWLYDVDHASCPNEHPSPPLTAPIFPHLKRDPWAATESVE